MRLASLQLTSFRSYTGIDLPIPAPKVYLSGVNGVGKSTIREAIKYALTGKCQGLDGKGAGSEVLVPTVNGSKSVHVAVPVEGIGWINRTWETSGANLSVQGFTGSSQTQQGALYERLETTEAILSSVLETEVFLRMHHADKKAILLALLNLKVQIGDDPENLWTLDEMDEQYRESFEARRVAKAAYKAFVLPTQPQNAAFHALDVIDAKLRELRKELETLLGEVGTVSGRRKELLRQMDRIQAQVPVRQHAKSGADLVAEIADLEERLGLMEESPAEEPIPEKGSPERATFLRSRIEALEAHDPAAGCVIDGQVPCKTAKLAFRNTRKDYEAELKKLPKEAQEGTRTPSTAILDVQRVLGQAKSDLALYESDLATRDRLVAEAEAINRELSTLPNVSSQEDTIDGLRERIRKGETIRQQAAAHWTAVQRFEEAHQKHVELKAEVDRLEMECSIYGPNGVRVAAIEQRLGDFTAGINGFTAPWGWTVKFTLDPWQVLVNDRPIETFSKSEQYRVGVAIQLAIAVTSKLSFAIVDEFDMLTKKNRNQLLEMLMRTPLDQILILSAKEPDAPLVVYPGVRMIAYRLGIDEGRTVVLEQAQG